ncbi:hypothetical protein GCM10027416_16900 [Okibacterium endophyticum]
MSIRQRYEREHNANDVLVVPHFADDGAADLQWLTATQWLMDRPVFGMLLPPAHGPMSIHLRALLDVVPILDARKPGRMDDWHGRSVVVAQPELRTLELLGRGGRFSDQSITWLILESGPDAADHAWQAAWLWAHGAVPLGGVYGDDSSRPSAAAERPVRSAARTLISGGITSAAPSEHPGQIADHAGQTEPSSRAPVSRDTLDPGHLLADEELWALALRSGFTPRQARQLRKLMRR